jgi:hypothetical protein
MLNDKLLETVPVDLLYQVLETEKGGVIASSFVQAISQHRHWERELAS